MSFRVLVVDDSETIRSVIRKALLISGLEIGVFLEASDGQSALDTLGREWVDIVFADINMPNMRGDEMIRRIRGNALTASLPIIVISSIRNGSIREEVSRHGISGYLTKPFYPEKLRAAIVKALDLRGDA